MVLWKVEGGCALHYMELIGCQLLIKLCGLDGGVKIDFYLIVTWFDIGCNYSSLLNGKDGLCDNSEIVFTDLYMMSLINFSV